MASCDNDLECPSMMNCYKNVSWDEETNIHGKCYCLTDFGWVGETCTGLGPGSVMMLAMSFIFAVLLFFMLASVCRDMSRTFTRSEFRKTSRDLAATIIYVLLAGIFLFTYKVNEIVTVFTPTNLIVAYKDGEPFRTHRLYDTRYYNSIAVAGSIATALALFRVGLLWIQLAAAAKSMQKVDHQIKLYRYCTLTFEIVFVLSQIPLISMGLFALSYFVAMPFLICVVCLFFWGRINIINVLSSASKIEEDSNQLQMKYSQNESSNNTGEDSMQTSRGSSLGKFSIASFRFKRRATPKSSVSDVIRFIKLSSTCLIVLSILYICCGVAYALTNSTIINPMGKRNFSPYNAIGLYPLFRELLFAFVILVVLAIERFTHRSVKNLHKTWNAASSTGSTQQFTEETVYDDTSPEKTGHSKSNQDLELV
uniref:Uncharacterized protein n=1 Tax=Mucochytrium quahogii TaxID=96639 RepID=A0A7S2S901_9STRA|mmetsp:Transcript_13699/g.22348  ORF Transcript_13699/g.22348 Transcript_13699/m.22348 type:complete len:424 (+) Transcript_13699:174-1445(+)|eukprot:CAMPEP_0203756276 /NCGR_PEP_ID=MMETSP0098-20131031/9576_1 /ASSEMBLY_ACC=CAM_ASM_000208 /TAXON_ID=96639 /ORGANISM=" , Strain NY0313808BC1" /LENGTH=423 /DNA_ID=CAMNT_0050648079 /DNA_START=97 /DNA_END=1368 /DNA_ORIENTATION=+